MVRRAVGAWVPLFGVCFVVYSCVEQADAPPPSGGAGTAGKAAGGAAGRAQNASGGAGHSGNGASDAAGAGAAGAPPSGTSSSGGAGNAGRAGGSGGTEDSLGGAGQTGTPIPVGQCASPRPWSANLEYCAGEYVHRPAAGQCELPPRNGEAGAAGTDSGNSSGYCHTDADCSRSPNGYCIDGLADIPDCFYGCREDADCGSNELCACVDGTRPATRDRIALGVCVSAECKIDADCGGKSLCVSALRSICVQGRERWPVYFECQSAEEDQCYSASACGEGGWSSVGC